MRLIPLFASLLFLTSCASAGHTLKYGFLPGGDYEYYSPLSPVDLKGKRYKLVITDDRKGNTIQCSTMTIPRDTELEGKTGLDYFSNNLRAMIMANNGVVDENSENVINVRLSAFSGDLRAIVYGHVYGFVQFDVSAGGLKKTYCAAMADGDEGAPVGRFSVDTRKGAFRKLVSGATRKALEEFTHNLAQN